MFKESLVLLVLNYGKGRKINTEAYDHSVQGDFTSAYSTRLMAGGHLMKDIFNDKIYEQLIVKR